MEINKHHSCTIQIIIENTTAGVSEISKNVDYTIIPNMQPKRIKISNIICSGLTGHNLNPLLTTDIIEINFKYLLRDFNIYTTHQISSFNPVINYEIFHPTSPIQQNDIIQIKPLDLKLFNTGKIIITLLFEY